MHAATVSVLTAFHALNHRIALTPEDVSAIDAAGSSLTPELWGQTLGLLREAEGRSGPVAFDLGYTELILSWLGIADEAAFVHEFGIGIGEALAADAAQLVRTARAVDCPQVLVREAVRCQITVTWCARANLLMDRLPETAAAAVEALEVALVHCPPDNTWHARLYEALASVAAVLGDRNREVNARARAAALRGNNGSDGELVRIAAARVLSILWCRSHGAFELGFERGLDPHIPADRAVWRRVRWAIEAGRLDQIPLPTEGFVAWSSRSVRPGQLGASCEVVSDLEVTVEPSDLLGVLEEAAPDLPALASAVRTVWSGEDGGPLDTLSGRHVAAVVIARRQAIEADWRPLPERPRCLFLEVWNGPYRDHSVERLALVELLHPVLALAARYDVAAGLVVALDQAASAFARDDAQALQVALGHVLSLSDQVASTSPWYGYGRVVCALYAWRCGDVDRALDALRPIGTQASTEAIEVIRATDDARRVAEDLEERWRSDPCLETGSRAADAHHEAGHLVRARTIACEVASRWPEDGAAWAALAGVLCRQARFRDAQAAARTSMERGLGPDLVRELLARVERGLCEQ